LTGAKLIQLAEGILVSGVTNRVLPKAVGQFVAEAVNAQRIPASSISGKVRAKIESLLRA